MTLDLYATLIFSYPRPDFKGCNWHALKIIELLDEHCIECRELSFKFEYDKIKMSVDVYASHDDLGLGNKQLFDEDDVEQWFADKLLCDFIFLFDAANSDLSEKTEEHEKNEQI